MSSTTESYSIRTIIGKNTFVLSAINGQITDHRVISLFANDTWSGAVFQGTLASNSILDVQLYYIDDVSVLGLTAVTNNFNDLDNKPTTLTGYGITDAKITNGTITLGSASITPITSIAAIPDSTINALS